MDPIDTLSTESYKLLDHLQEAGCVVNIKPAASKFICYLAYRGKVQSTLAADTADEALRQAYDWHIASLTRIAR
jgi:hypothetical protein